MKKELDFKEYFATAQTFKLDFGKARFMLAYLLNIKDEEWFDEECNKYHY